jgi:hypothetical protein
MQKVAIVESFLNSRCIFRRAASNPYLVRARENNVRVILLT